MSLVSIFIFHVAFLKLPNNQGFVVELFAILVNGFFISALMSFDLEYAVELAPNVSKPMSSGVLMFCINALSLI
jgi:hypothetical protein